MLLTLGLATLSPSPVYADRSPPPSTLPADVEKQQKFARLWEQRFDRDVSAEILPLIDDPELDFAQRAVRALGRLENPTVLAELERRRGEQQAQIKEGLADFSKLPKRLLQLDTAIARIQSRNLHGQEKIEFVTERMPLKWNWQQAIEWSRKVSNPKNYLTISPAAAQIREIVDLLYVMARNGEDIGPLRRQFTFTTAQDVQLDAASLSRAEEAEHLLDYSQTLDIVSLDDEYVCESHFLSLGDVARTALKNRLLLLLQTKPHFAHRFPLACMLRAAAMTGDMSLLPIVQGIAIELTYVPYTQNDAGNAEIKLKSKTAFPFAPQ